MIPIEQDRRGESSTPAVSCIHGVMHAVSTEKMPICGFSRGTHGRFSTARSAEALKTEIGAAGIASQDIVKALNDTGTALQDRRSEVPSLDSEDALGAVSQFTEKDRFIRNATEPGPAPFTRSIHK